MANIKGPQTLAPPTTGTNLGEDIKSQNEARENTKEANEALNTAGITIDPNTQVVDTAGLAKASREWKDYMQNFLENNTQRIIDNTVPVFEVSGNKVRITGTDAALSSPLANDAKKALSSLVGADVTSDSFKQAIDELNTSLRDNVKNYVITQGYGFQDAADYDNYLLAVQESRKPNPRSSTFLITAKKKDGSYDTMTIDDWLKYWQTEYSTDERADLFLSSAESNYGYDRIPYILMSGGGDRGNAIYGFDTGERLSLGVYNIGKEVSKLPHGLTQYWSGAAAGAWGAVDNLERLFGMSNDQAKKLVLETKPVSKEEFDKIKEKLVGVGPKKGGVDNLSDREKAILTLGVYSTDALDKAQDILGNSASPLSQADYSVFMSRVNDIKNSGLAEREEKMNEVDERIAKNMMVYGGQSLNFASTMLGVLARQAIEAFTVKALTGAVGFSTPVTLDNGDVIMKPGLDMNSFGETLGDSLIDAMGGLGGNSIAGDAAARTLARFVGGIPEDMLQDLVDSKLTGDNSLADDILTGENIVSNIVYRLTFNAIAKGTKNFVKEARNLRNAAKAARKAGVNIDADDIKRGVSEAVDALEKGRELVYGEDGSVKYYDDDGNLKELDGVTLWNMQPLADNAPDNVISDNVKNKLNELTEKWKSEKKTKVDDMTAARDFFNNGEWNYTVGKIPGDENPVEIPSTLRSALTTLVANQGVGIDKSFDSIKAKLPDWGLDVKSISKVAGDDNNVKATIAVFNDVFDTDISIKDKSLNELLGDMVKAIYKKANMKITKKDTAPIVSELMAENRFGSLMKQRMMNKGYRPASYVFGLKGPINNFTGVLNKLETSSFKDSNGEIKPYIEMRAEASAYPEMVLRDATEELVADVMDSYAGVLSDAVKNTSINNVVEFASMTVDSINNIIQTSDGSAVDKVDLKHKIDDVMQSLAAIEYQQSYNRNFTELPHYVTQGIHSTNELGVKMNADKEALMAEALTKTPTEFVWGKLDDFRGLHAGNWDKFLNDVRAGNDISYSGINKAEAEAFASDILSLEKISNQASSDNKPMVDDFINKKTEEWFKKHASEPVSKEGYTQNELLEIWTEAQYRAMTPEKMLEIMTENFGDASLLGENMQPHNQAITKAENYIGSPFSKDAPVDRRYMDYWFGVTKRGNAEYDTWLDELIEARHPAFYRNADGSIKESGRSILELYVLQDPKLWAASLIKLKSDIGEYARQEALSVATKIAEKNHLDNFDLGKLEKALEFVYAPSSNGSLGAEARIGTALGIFGGNSLDNGASPEMSELFESYKKETGASVMDTPTDFVEWAAEKYAMGTTLYSLKEHSNLYGLPMDVFLTSPLTVGRVEKIWGPGRLVDNGNGPELPSMQLEKETTLGFSVDTTGVGFGAHDPGSVTMQVRPIDIIGDLRSPFAGEKEVFVRKSLVYPAGNKMHSVFFDGMVTTNARSILDDKNARLFQIDESLIVNQYDYDKIKNIFRNNKEIINKLTKVSSDADFIKSYLKKYADGESTADAPYDIKTFLADLSKTVYSKEIATALSSDNPFMRTLSARIFEEMKTSGYSVDLTQEVAILLNKPLVVKDYSGKVLYQKGIVPEFDSEVATNGGLHLNDPQAQRTADAQQVLKDWRDAANNIPEAEKYKFFVDNAGVTVDGNTVSFSDLMDNQETRAMISNARSTANMASNRITMDNRLEGTPEQAPDPIDWGKDKTFEFKSYADALANRPSYKDAQYFDKWLPAAVEAGMKEFNDWHQNVFMKNHPDIDMAQTVESWDYVNFLVHQGEDIQSPNMDEIIGKTFIDSSGKEVTITQDVIDMYGEYDTFIRQQGARIAALRAHGFYQDYNQLGYLPHTDYNPLEQSAEEMMQGVLWKKNELKNSSSEDGTFTTEKLNNNFEDRYRVWISNMSFDSLGDVAIFGEKMKELIADGVITVNKRGAKLNGKKPQEAVAKAISGDKNLNEQAAKTKSSKDFLKTQTDINDKTDFKKLAQQTDEDANKMGYSKAINEHYSPLYGGNSKVTNQKNVFVSKITGLYDFMKNTSTTDGSLLNHGGEMLLNPAGMANNIVRQYAQGDKTLKELVTTLLMEKSGRSRKGAEYVYNKWLPDITKHIRDDGTINSTELAAILTKHLRFEAWTGIKKWLGRADYSGFNMNTRKTMDNLLYRHNMVQQVSSTPSVMKTINKALNTIVGARHRALFYLNPKNAFLQLSECIRLFTEFKLGDASKSLYRLSTDESWRNYVMDWKDIVMPEATRLSDVQPMADAWGKTASFAKLKEDGTLDIKGTVKGGIQDADAVGLAPIDAAENMKNVTLLSGILQEMETKKKNGTLKESEYDFVMRRFQRIALANDEFGRLGYSDSGFARALLYLQNFSIRQLKMFGDNVIDTWGSDGAAKAFGYIAKTFGWRMGLFLVMAKLGYSAGQVLGYDPFGMLGNDYTGLDEEDETELDKQIKSGWLSPLFTGGVTSLVQNYYFAGRQAYERSNTATPADEAESIAQDTEDWGWKMPDVDWFGLLYSWAPGGQAIKRNIEMSELLDKGVAVSNKGTKMYEAPSDLGNVLAGFTFGQKNTANAREYYQTPDPLQGLIDNGLGGFAQQMGRAFRGGFREFDPIDTENYSDWFDGSAADEQQWQSGYYYFRNKAKEIYDAYNGADSTFSSSTDTAELKSNYERQMNEVGDSLRRFTEAYVKKHGTLDGTKMQQLVNILNDAQINLLMDEETRNEESLAGLNRAQDRYTNAELPQVTRQTGPSTSHPETELGTRLSPQFYSAVQGYYGAPEEAYDIVNKLYKDKWKKLRKEYSAKAYADGTSYSDREKIQNEYIDLVRQDLDGIVALYGKNIFTNDKVDDVMTDVFAGMVPYGEYNVNKKGRRVSLPSNVEVDVSEWLTDKYSRASSAPSVERSAKMDELLERMRGYQDSGNISMAKSMARLILERVNSNRGSLNREQIEEVQGVIND